jgi:hypothetical protein
METATHDDCWQNYLRFRVPLATLVRQTLGPGETAKALTMRNNDRYAAAMCRIRYLRVSAPMPAADDVNALANYWKQHYNTPLGAGSPSEFTAKWAQFTDQHTFD